ncbi:MAG: arsenate reductase ArsC [Pelomonas sp.]|nr:arsenate reductase ArsC [Roseateles sp.]
MTVNVLILCTHNSARSQLAEAMLNHWAARLGRDLRAYSAGSAPSGRVNPDALAALANAGVDVGGLRSKRWDEFGGADAPLMDIVITVCDGAAGEACPHWPGRPVKVHWGYPDPSDTPAAGRAQAFELTRQALGYRMRLLLDLPLAAMNPRERQDALAEIATA